MKKVLIAAVLSLAFVASASATVTLPEYWVAEGISQYQNSGNLAQNPMVPKRYKSGYHANETACNSEVAYQNGLYPDGTTTPINAVNVYRHVDAICHKVYPFQLIDKWYIVGTRQVKANLVNGENFDIKIGPFNQTDCGIAKTQQMSLTLQGTPIGGINVGTSLKAKCMILK